MLADVKTAYPDKDIPALYKDAGVYCYWLSSRPWWNTHVPSAEGGWASFKRTALLYGLNGKTFRKGLEEYGRILIDIYRGDDSSDIYYDPSLLTLVESEQSGTVFTHSSINGDIAEAGASSLERPHASQSYASYTNVITSLFCPPLSQDAVDALTFWATNRSYIETAEMFETDPEDIRALIQTVMAWARKHPTIEAALARSRKKGGHTRWHSEAPSKWCYWCM